MTGADATDRAPDPRGPVFDAHLHIIDPRFPLQPNQGYLPPPFTVAEYRRHVAPLGVAGGAVVSGSFQGFDQTYLLAALEELGPGFVGVTQLPGSVTDAAIRRLDAAGVRAVRFNLHRGGSAGLAELVSLAQRVYQVAGWHVELYVTGEQLAELESLLAQLPRIVIDHLGLSAAGLPALLRLVDRGARVKASGFGRVSLDVPATLRAITEHDPAAPLFGSDLPSTRARRPFRLADVDVLLDSVGAVGVRRVLWDNAVALYRPAGLP